MRDRASNDANEEVSPTMRELAMGSVPAAEVVCRDRGIGLCSGGGVCVGWSHISGACACAGASRAFRSPPAAAQDNAPPDFSRVEVTEEELNSEVELLKDDDVLRRVAEANDLAAHDWLRWLRPHEEQAARAQRAAKKLASKLEVESIKKTHLIAVSYGASDPQLAVHVLQVAGKRLSGETYGSPPAAGTTALLRSADRGVAPATGRSRGKAG